VTAFPGTTVAKLGLRRGGIELRQTFTYWPDLVQALFIPAAGILVLFLLRGHHAPGSAFSLGSLTLPGFIGMNFAMGGTLGVTGLIAGDREDGTLLRAKATPGGMTAYVVGKITFSAATTILGLVITIILGLAAFPGVTVHWLTLIWVAVLGLLATIPLGIALGSILPNPRYIPLVLFPVGGLTAISGIFYPITHLAGWLQAIAQIFPLYWLGLGFRAALLPAHLASVELNGSWRLPLVLLTLVLWSALGLASAPPVLRRMARRESGSRVAARRERAMLRAT
jgi:ABC-2 type transport system permease protein